MNSKYPIYLSKRDSYQLLKNNDTYYRTFRPLDLKARGIKRIDDYFPIIRKSIDQFTSEEKEMLRDATEEADRRLSRIVIEGFDGKKASRIPWKIVCMKGKKYENGFPHTIESSIVLFKEMMKGIKNNEDYEEIVSLLMHEKVHVYQRRYKRDIKRYLRANRFVAVYDYRRSERRANPDIDRYIYRKGDRVYETRYRTLSPQTIDDIIHKKHEHPFEEMAYLIQKL